jgi:hypothetical protein
MVVKRVLSMSLIMITVLTLDFTFDMTYAMAVGAQNKTLANFGHDHLCRSASSDRCTQTETFGLPVVEVENSPVVQTATKTMGLFLQLQEQVFTPAPSLEVFSGCVPALPWFIPHYYSLFRAAINSSIVSNPVSQGA